MHLWWVRACLFICVRMAWDPLNMLNIALTMSRKSKHSFRIDSLLNAVRTYILHCRSFACNEMLELFRFSVVAFWQFYRIYNRLLTSNSKIITRFNSWLFVVNFYFLPKFWVFKWNWVQGNWSNHIAINLFQFCHNQVFLPWKLI